MKSVIEMAQQNIASRQLAGGFAYPQDLTARVDDDNGFGGLVQNGAGEFAVLDHGFVMALFGQIGNDSADGVDSAGFQAVQRKVYRDRHAIVGEQRQFTAPAGAIYLREERRKHRLPVVRKKAPD